MCSAVISLRGNQTCRRDSRSRLRATRSTGHDVHQADARLYRRQVRGRGFRRDWTYIDDVIDGFVNAVQRSSGYEIINIGCGNPIKLSTFIEHIEDLSGRTSDELAQNRTTDHLLRQQQSSTAAGIRSESRRARGTGEDVPLV